MIWEWERPYKRLLSCSRPGIELVMVPFQRSSFVLWLPSLRLLFNSFTCQWRMEIEKYTKPGSLSVLIYHGSGRTTDTEVLTGYDVVLTSYQVLESSYRQQTKYFVDLQVMIF